MSADADSEPEREVIELDDEITRPARGLDALTHLKSGREEDLVLEREMAKVLAIAEALR